MEQMYINNHTGELKTYEELKEFARAEAERLNDDGYNDLWVNLTKDEQDIRTKATLEELLWTGDWKINRYITSFAGHTPSVVQDLMRDMELEYDGDEVKVWMTSKVYTHDETEDGGELKFDYKYAVRITDLSAYGDDNITCAEILLVPTYRSLCEAQQRAVCDCMGIDLVEEETDRLTCDVLDYGISVVMAHESYEGKLDMWDEERVVNVCANIIPCIDSLRGFYLDRCVNRIGWTGWDILNEAVLDIPCSF